MALRNIIKEGDPALRRKSREVGEVTDRIREILGDMVDTMRENRGVGLAGPQIGIMRRLFVAEPDPEADPPLVYYMVDPEIYEEEGSEIDEEGCLSVPGLIGDVERPYRVKIRAKDFNGDLQDYEFGGFAARIMCHENDHLNGILYIDKAIDVREPVYEYDEEDDEMYDDSETEIENDAEAKIKTKPREAE
ncbi:MAG: peptide deformylase [Firmicutes bacterium]|nr:peptide deformylase [Bacillota bacterium]